MHKASTQVGIVGIAWLAVLVGIGIGVGGQATYAIKNAVWPYVPTDALCKALNPPERSPAPSENER